ncbi:HTH_Tnp_Tc3_2 domain-containing protein [Trichonephila clavipes]|nr:HTH_Tnp_Tc3_2 domain-containing protein [Trichonephila clavipes]
MGRSDVAIRRRLQVWVDKGIFPRHDASGRPSITADQKDQLSFKTAVILPDSLLSSIRRATHIRVSIMTIHRRLIELNLRLYRPLYHLSLTPAH